MRYEIASTASEAVSRRAADYLRSMQKELGSSCADFGFDPEVFAHMTASPAFTVYTFDARGEVLRDKVYMSLLQYSGEVVGNIGVYYDSANRSWHCSLGTAYAEGMNSLLLEADLDAEEGIVIGRVGNKLIATDGKKVKVLFEYPFPAEEVYLEAICGRIRENAASCLPGI
ncbi:MAG: hypothetical protein ACSW8F_05385 [bacterium]